MPSTDWSIPFRASYRLMRVSARTRLETSTVRHVVSGLTIERNRDVSVKESATLTSTESLDFGADWLRIYLEADFMGAQPSATECLGTFLVSQPRRTVGRAVSLSECDLYSTLRSVADVAFPGTKTVPVGANPVDAAQQVIESCGLQVVREPGGTRLAKARTYGLTSEGGDGSALECANDLLQAGGYWAAYPDAYGRVLLRRYLLPSERPVSATFSEGPGCRFLADMTDEFDKFGVANCAKVVWSGESGAVVGVARDDDPESPFSTATVGREIWHVEYSSEELTEATARARAVEILASDANVTRRITLEHTYRPLALNEVVRLDYPTGGIEGDFFVRTMTLDGTRGGLLTRTEVKTFDPAGDREAQGA